MIGLVITAFNRAKHTKGLMESLNQTLWPNEEVLIVYVDDCSIHDEAVDILHSFKIDGVPVIKVRNESNLGISQSLKTGFEICLDNGCDTLVNLDNDTIVKPNWLLELLYLHDWYFDDVITGFNTLSIDLGTQKPRQDLTCLILSSVVPDMNAKFLI
jgi:glycosyltransferase involved in cell wall biosynthesis